MQNILNKNFLLIIFFFIFSFFLIYANIAIGTFDKEEYYSGIFTSKFYFDNSSFSNWFKSFYDLIGPGVTLPIGNGHYFYPTSFFLYFSNYKIFLFSTILFNSFIQVFYFNKILRIFNCSQFNYLNSIFVISAVPNLAYTISNDLLSFFTAYTLFFPIIYYLLKIKKDFKNFIKFTLCCSIIILNCALSYVFMLLHLIIIFGIVNNLFFLFKKKYFYLILLLFFLIVFGHLSYIYSQYLEFSSAGVVHLTQATYTPRINYFIVMLFFPLWKILEIFFGFDIGYSFTGSDLFLGFFVLFATIQSIKIIIENNSKKFFYLNYLFFLFFIFCFIPNKYFINLITGSWLFRDFFNILGLVLFVVFLNDFKSYFEKIKKIKFFYKPVLILIICGSIFTSAIWIHHFYSLDKIIQRFYSSDEMITPTGLTSYIAKNNKNDKLANLFEKIDKPESLERIYFGKKIYYDMRYKFQKTNHPILINSAIRDSTDLIQFGLSPFNATLKNSSVNKLRKPERSMHLWIVPLNEELQNMYFTSLFRIKYILLYESSYNYLEINDYKIINKLDLEDDSLYLLENNKFDQKMILKNNNLNLTNDCPELQNIICLLSKYKDNLSFTSKINFERISINTYKIVNNGDKDYQYFLPFIFDKNWRVKNKKNKIQNINESLMLVNIKSGEEIILFYENYIRLFFKITMLISFIILIFLVFFKKIKH